MSVGATPSLNFIGDTVGDAAPHAMSEMRGIRFASGNSPTIGAISLSDFRNQVLTKSLVWSEPAKFQASDKQAYDVFGISVSISSDGNTAIVGAYGEGTGGDYAGAAYIFTRSGTTWTEQAKIQASDREEGDGFGYAVSISSDGNTALVGAGGDDTDTGGDAAGAAYIFTRSGTTWTQQARIQASDRQEGDGFGYLVSISGGGNTALVGASGDETDTGEPLAGAAYIFTRSGTTWTQQAKIQASDRQDRDVFGETASISGDGNTAIVGARGQDTRGDAAGAAYIFTRSGTTWTQQAKIHASDTGRADFFGSAVSISGDGNTALVGAYGDDTDTGGDAAGAAYIFTRSGTTWTQQAKIQASDREQYNSFGQNAVSISGDGNTAIVGVQNVHAIVGTNTIFNVGAAYIFTRSGTTWTEQAKIQASDRQFQDFFGRSVSISSGGNIALVGAFGVDTGGTNAGAVYMSENSYYI